MMPGNDETVTFSCSTYRRSGHGHWLNSELLECTSKLAHLLSGLYVLTYSAAHALSGSASRALAVGELASN